jgi:hypothetical protein
MRSQDQETQLDEESTSNRMLKPERASRRRYRSVADARADVFDYIERFHNPRIQRRIDSLTQGRVT